MPAMKRPAAASSSAAASTSAAKKRARDPLAAKGDEIAAMMKGAEGFPASVIHMIATTLDKSLLIPKDQRHAVQDEVIEMVEKVLLSVEQGLKSKVEAAQAKVAGSDAEKVSREQALEAARAVLEEKKGEAEKAKEALEEAAGEEVTAKAALADAKAEQKSGDAGYEKASEKKKTLENALANEYEALKQGTASNVKKAVQAILQVGKQFSFESQLLVSADPALSKAPAERGGFDTLVLQQLEEQFKNLISSLDEELSTGEAAKAERAAKVEAATAQLATTGERFQACKAEVAATHAASKESDASSKAAEKALKELGPELEVTGGELEEANAGLKDCEAVIATFRELQERTSEPPAAATEEPPAEAVAAAE